MQRSIYLYTMGEAWASRIVCVKFSVLNCSGLSEQMSEEVPPVVGQSLENLANVERSNVASDNHRDEDNPMRALFRGANSSEPKDPTSLPWEALSLYPELWLVLFEIAEELYRALPNWLTHDDYAHPDVSDEISSAFAPFVDGLTHIRLSNGAISVNERIMRLLGLPYTAVCGGKARISFCWTIAGEKDEASGRYRKVCLGVWYE